MSRQQQSLLKRQGKRKQRRYYRLCHLRHH